MTDTITALIEHHTGHAPERPRPRFSRSTALPAYITIREASDLLRRKPYPLHQAITRGELRAFQPGGSGPWLSRPADLRAYVEAGAS